MRCGNNEQCVIIKNIPTCVCNPGFDETNGCNPSQRGKIFSIQITKNILLIILVLISAAIIFLQHPVMRRITVLHMDSAVLTGIGRNMCAFVCPVTSVSGKAQKNFLPTVDNL